MICKAVKDNTDGQWTKATKKNLFIHSDGNEIKIDRKISNSIELKSTKRTEIKDCVL